MCGEGIGVTSVLRLEPCGWSCLENILRADPSRGLLEYHPVELFGYWYINWLMFADLPSAPLKVTRASVSLYLGATKLPLLACFPEEFE
jgi:hypothetical protein